MAKKHGGINADDFANLLFKQLKAAKEGVEPYAKDAGEQVGESFADGIESGLEDATNRIMASSLKINKAFKDLAKKIENKNLSLGGINVDFSDIDINEASLKKKIDEVFEKFKVDNIIEFDSKTAENQFKNMLGLHTKYAAKLSKLQEQRPKLTNQTSIKSNAQEQLALIDGIKEIQKMLDQASGLSVQLPHVRLGDVKELRTSINLIEQMEKGEEKIAKQRDANIEKIKKENKELKERNSLYEEKYGSIQDGVASNTKKARAKKIKEEYDPVEAKRRGEEMLAFGSQLVGLEKDLGDPGKWLNQYNELMFKIQQGALTAADAVAQLRTNMGQSKTQTTTHQEIKSQIELQEEIEHTNSIIKNQKRWLEYLDPVLNDDNFKTSGKREATEQLKSKTNNLVDFRRHPDQYAHLEMYEEKVEVSWAKAYKEAERQGVAQSTLNRHYTDAGRLYDANLKKLQDERDWHAKTLEESEKKLTVLQQQLQTETNIENVHKRKFIRTMGEKPGKFRINKQSAETYETESGQMSMLPAVQEEIDAKNNLAVANEKVAKSQKKIKEAERETQMSIDDIIPQANSETVNNVINSAAKVTKITSEEAKRAADNMRFSTRDYEKLYEEMEAFAEHRKAENGYDLSRVSVNTDAVGRPLGATISYYKKATKETIVETFKIDKASQEASDSVDRLVLNSRKATAGLSDLEKATLQAINRQDQLITQKNKTVSSMSYVLDPNSNRSLAGTAYEEETRGKIQAIKDEVAKLDQVDSAGERIILPEKDFLAIKRRIAELTQDARDFINASKNAEYAPTQLESHSVSSGNKYRKDQLSSYINDWKNAGIYFGDLQVKAEELAGSVDKITKHEELKKYLEGMKEARALAKLATQDKRAEEARQDALNKEYKEYVSLIEKRDAIESKMIGLDPIKNRDELAALRADYNVVDNEWNSKYGDFLSRKDVQDHFTIGELAYADDAARRKMAIKEGRISDKRRLDEEAAAQKRVNEAYQEYVRLIQERGRVSVKIAGLDTEKNQLEIESLTAHIRTIDDEINRTYGGLLSDHVAQATLTLEDFMKYYDKWQQKVMEKEAKAADKDRNKKELPYRNYGKTTANSVQRKLEQTQGAFDSLSVNDSSALAQMEAYRVKAEEVIKIREQFANDPEAAKNGALVQQFQRAVHEAEQLRRKIKSIIDEEQKMAQMSMDQGFDPIELSSDQIANLEQEMIAHAKATAQGRFAIKGWNDDHTKMYYTVTDSNGAVHEMTESFGQYTHQLYQTRTATKETGTLMQQIFSGIKVKAKELISYVIGGGSVYKVITMIKQGVQYVRDIDLALTELKKVTDETEETYKQFLDTASKTAAKVGSTIKDVVSSTADWARLNI